MINLQLITGPRKTSKTSDLEKLPSEPADAVM